MSSRTIYFSSFLSVCRIVFGFTKPVSLFASPSHVTCPSLCVATESRAEAVGPGAPGLGGLRGPEAPGAAGDAGEGGGAGGGVAGAKCDAQGKRPEVDVFVFLLSSFFFSFFFFFFFCAWVVWFLCRCNNLSSKGTLMERLWAGCPPCPSCFEPSKRGDCFNGSHK